jgi:hypothetical protein
MQSTRAAVPARTAFAFVTGRAAVLFIFLSAGTRPCLLIGAAKLLLLLIT